MVAIACCEVLLAIDNILVTTDVMVIHHVAIDGESLGELFSKVHRHIVLTVVGIARSHVLVATSGYHGDIIACLTEKVGNQLGIFLVIVAPADASRGNQRAVELSLGLEVEHIVYHEF